MGPISQAGNRDLRADGSAGFVLVEQVAVLALVGLLILLAFPIVRPGTDQSRFHELWTNTAALLRDARTSALVRGDAAEVTFDRRRRTIQSRKHVLQLPANVDVKISAGGSCAATADRIQIVFRANGTSCGGILQFSLKDRVARIRVNWLTGHIAAVQGRGES